MMHISGANTFIMYFYAYSKSAILFMLNWKSQVSIHAKLLLELTI